MVAIWVRGGASFRPYPVTWEKLIEYYKKSTQTISICKWDQKDLSNSHFEILKRGRRINAAAAPKRDLLEGSCDRMPTVLNMLKYAGE
jgi:hypothetical protein